MREIERAGTPVQRAQPACLGTPLQRAGSILCDVKNDAEYEIGPPSQDNS